MDADRVLIHVRLFGVGRESGTPAEMTIYDLGPSATACSCTGGPSTTAPTPRPRRACASVPAHGRRGAPHSDQDRLVRGAARRGRPRAAALLGRPRHERDAQVDPGRVRGRGGRAHREPGPARRGLRGGARARPSTWARSTATWWTRARSSRDDYVLPAIKANALYGGGYPLFTALGRPLIAKLAVEKARESGCDTIAHGCTGKGNDQVRIESTVVALAPELKIIAPVRGWQMGREEEIAVRARARHPGEGRDRDAALLDRRQPLGPLVRGRADRGHRRAAARRRVRARHAARGRARRAARTWRSSSSAGARWR